MSIRVCRPKWFGKLFNQSLSLRTKGNTLIFSTGMLLTTLTVGVLAVDMPTYLTAQNELQTAVNAAALAGAAALPSGNNAARNEAIAYAEQNPVGNTPLTENDLTIDLSGKSIRVSASKPVPTILAKMLCADQFDYEQAEGNGTGSGGRPESCDWMTIHATAKAVPAARDTVLVIDTSTSMVRLSGGQPFKDVKSAAQAYVDHIDTYDNESVDRIGLMSFDRTGKFQVGLTNNFDSVRTKIRNLSIYSGSGWNTNYQPGLKLAIDEIQAKGRPNAAKMIIFLTDGYNNLPEFQAGKSFGSTCGNFYNKRQYSQARTCAQNYTSNFVNLNQVQVARAEALGIKIHTIRLDSGEDSSMDDIRKALGNMAWDPQLLELMANSTHGDMYNTTFEDSRYLTDFYEEIANDVRMKLTN
jgi:hypothetical protein